MPARHPLAHLLRHWRERRHAARTSRELVRLRRAVSSRQPGLAGRALYRQVLLERAGARADADSIDALLQHAHDSFASWPVERALTFRDIVHYVAVSDWLARRGEMAWTEENLGALIAEWVPASW